MKKYTLITGASAGIGYELARIAAANGCNLLLTARRIDKLNELAAELKSENGIDVITVAKDLSDRAAAEFLFDFCLKNNIQINHLINNAGFGDLGLFADSEITKQRDMIQINIMALTLLSRLFLPDMVKAGYGRILNVASVAAFQPGPTMSVYYATKAYVLHFSEAIANELEGTGVTVTTLCPGPTESEFKYVANMEESGLMKNRKNPSSRAVAEYGYRAMMRGKKVAIHGLLNALMVFTVRLSPRSWVVRIARFMTEPKKN
jgi:short-subunit dehydrogenase